MAKLKSDSPIARRIVTAFLDFLHSVELEKSSDAEAVEVTKECLTEAFKIDQSVEDKPRISDLLVTVFTAIEANESQDCGLGQGSGVDSSVIEKSCNTEDAESKVGECETSSGSPTTGLSKDDLFAQFIAALEKAQYFKNYMDGHCDSNLTDKATQYFHDVINDMERGTKTFNLINLADSLKSRGNKAMQSKSFLEAAELYSCAIALSDNNAVYYCNRAAALTHLQMYLEAMNDCLKSIEIDPNYSKAYSRLGLAYYARGDYVGAINNGFRRALELDPNNESLKENIRMAERKLNEEMHRSQHYQNDTPAYFNEYQEGGQGSMRIPPMPFDASRIPVDMANLVSNLSANVTNQASNDTGFSIPGINPGSGSFNVNMDGQMPQEVLRSVMSMFSGASQQGNGVNNPNP